MSDNIDDVTQDDFNDEVRKADKPVLVDFWADWCAPCKDLKPRLEAVADEVEEVKFVAVDIDENADLASELNIRSIPNMVLFQDGDQVDNLVGSVTKNSIKEFLADNT